MNRHSLSRHLLVIACIAAVLWWNLPAGAVAFPGADGRLVIAAAITNPDGLKNLTPAGTSTETDGNKPGTSASEGAGEGGNYTVNSGDTLWDIASRFYGDGGRWIEIFKANIGRIANPNLIFPGQIFAIPSLPPGTTISSGETPSAKPDSSGKIVIPVSHIYQGANPRMPWSTCGPTSLAMILRYYGKNVTPDGLIGPTGCTEAEGTYIGRLASTAKQYGFPNAYNGSGYDLNWLDKQLAAGKPVLVNVKYRLRDGSYSGHYMVVNGVDAQGNYICNDPAKPSGPTTFTRSDLWFLWKTHHNAAAVVLS